MKPKLPLLLTAAALGLLVSNGTSFAMGAELMQLQNITRNELRQLNVRTDGLDSLTLSQLTELAAIIDGPDVSTNRAIQARNFMNRVAPPTRLVAYDSASQQLRQRVRTDFAHYGMTYPGDEALTDAQVAKLRGIFGGTDDRATKKRDAQAVLAHAGGPRNAGVEQMRATVVNRLALMGVHVPASVQLTDDEVVKLYSIVHNDQMSSDQQKQAAVNMLGL